MPVLLNQQCHVPVFLNYIPAFRVFCPEAEHTSRPKKVVTIRQKGAPHLNKPTLPAILFAIHRTISDFYPKGGRPIRDGGLSFSPKTMLRFAEVHTGQELSQELSIRTGAESRDLFARFRLKHQEILPDEEHEPLVKPMLVRLFIV
jgi:hypothetical protein